MLERDANGLGATPMTSKGETKMLQLNQNAYKLCIKTGNERQFEKLLESMGLDKNQQYFTSKNNFGTCYTILAFDDEAEIIQKYVKTYYMEVV